MSAKSFDPTIHYLVVVSEWRPEEASPLAGFALDLCRHHFMLGLLHPMPVDPFEFTEEFRSGVASRRMTGALSLQWHGQSPRALQSMPIPAEMPFVFVLLGPDQNPDDYRKWAASCPTVPTIVAEANGDMSYNEFSVEGLRKRLLEVCDHASSELDPDELDRVKAALQSWQPFAERPLPFEIGGHNTIRPNLASLRLLGFAYPPIEPFLPKEEGVASYVEQILLTTNLVLETRDAEVETLAETTFPRRPAINLFAPAVYPSTSALKLKPDAPRQMQKDFQQIINLVERQSGYRFSPTQVQARALLGKQGGGAEDSGPHFIMQVRAMELALATDAVSLLAASELSAVIRLPNDVNRTSGAVRQFANHYRSNARSPFKTREAFRSVQQHINQSVPERIAQLLSARTDDVRIVADAHLEWLDIDGLPLALRRAVTRIPVTPGNLFIEQVGPKPVIRLIPESFEKILVVTALKRSDPIKGMFEKAFEIFGKHWRDRIEVSFVEAHSKEALIEAFNNFDGAMVIFDGHGSHPDKGPGFLHLGDVAIDVWSLRGEIRVPPIVVLSACDTHAADRNHATTASGFLMLGATSVLASTLPLEAKAAATFCARLVYRVAEFLPAAVGLYGRALTWSELVAGMLRMQFSTEYLRELERKRMIGDTQYRDIHLAANMAINGLRPDPWSDILDKLESIGVDRARAWQEMKAAVATSSVISYLHMGRPETILLDTREHLEKRWFNVSES